MIRLIQRAFPRFAGKRAYVCIYFAVFYIYVASKTIKQAHDNLTKNLHHVYALGHRKIAFIHGEATAVTRSRLASFHRTCMALGLHIPGEYVIPARYHDPRASGLATRALLALKDRPDCILYPDDISILGGMTEIEARGLSVPEDISIAGYDGITMSKLLRPMLTTLHQDSEAPAPIPQGFSLKRSNPPKPMCPSFL
ncbi:MAG: substrate-binding domain-containing protein [Firmicutes bacterium]|nr:substrate-binding domain-containing protein [Bacillota bacterium]